MLRSSYDRWSKCLGETQWIGCLKRKRIRRGARQGFGGVAAGDMIDEYRRDRFERALNSIDQFDEEEFEVLM